MNRREVIISTLKSYFNSRCSDYNIELAVLYGSYAHGHPREESDIDIAVLFSDKMGEEGIFKIADNIALELTNILKHEINILHIDWDLSKPMLHYNAIVYGIPVFMKDFTLYVDVVLKAIGQMEDFSIFGIKWQFEIANKRLEKLNHAGV